MSDFFNKKFSGKSFLKMDKKLEPQTVVVQNKNGSIKEHHNITNPWKYIAKCKQNPDVKNAWIKT